MCRFAQIVIFQLFGFQAKILARYKPTINATLLIPSLKEAEKMAAKALEYFKSTRHIVLYYEDIITNHTVSTVTKVSTGVSFP